eukprot:295255_1
MAWYFGVAIVLPILLALYFTKSLTTLQKGVLLACLPILLGVYLKFGDELKARSVSWKDIVGNDKVVAVSQNKEKTFHFPPHDYDDYDLEQVLLKWGVNPSGMGDKKEKMDLLLQVSSADFWRKNSFLHPKKGRVSNYMWIHARYLSQLAALKDIQSKAKLLIGLQKFEGKLVGHAYYEDEIMFKFLKENIEMDDTLAHLVNDLNDEHKPFHNTLKDIIKQCEPQSGVSLQEIIAKIQQFEKPLIKHFTQEDQHVVPVFLNLNNQQYRKYRTYLTWKYYFMY